METRWETQQEGAFHYTPEFEDASKPYEGRWHRLVSTTNWEKGRIVSQWRQRLIDLGAPRQAYSNEVWSRRVGHVSAQHVGRLRRVFERFGTVYEDYPGLYWSHFLAALDWPDAEMWLEGAVQNGWTVAQMEQQRWQATVASPDNEPQVLVAELHEAAKGSQTSNEPLDAGRGPDTQTDATTAAALPAESQIDPGQVLRQAADCQNPPSSTGELAQTTRYDPTPLPEDLADALEALKVAILNHKLSGWQEVSPGQVLQALECIKRLVVHVEAPRPAPAG